MIWSGGMAWIADFPDPSNFYGPILGCAGAVQGGWNWTWYCNKAMEKRATKADAMSKPEQKEERAKVWAQIFTDIRRRGALDSGVQRAPRRRQVEAHGRSGQDLYRSDPRHRLRRDLHQEVTMGLPHPALNPLRAALSHQGRGQRSGTAPELAFLALAWRETAGASPKAAVRVFAIQLKGTSPCAWPATTRSTERTTISPGAETSPRR